MITFGISVLAAIIVALSLALGAVADNAAILSIVQGWELLGVMAFLCCLAAFFVMIDGRTRGPLWLRVAAVLAVVVCGILLLPSTQLLYRAATASDVQEQAEGAGSEHARLQIEDQEVSEIRRIGEDLSRSVVARSVVRGGDLGDSDLSQSDLRGSRFEGVNFAGVSLCGADIRGTDLSEALNLDRVGDWSFAFYNDSTVVPDGIDLATLRGPIKDNGSGLLYSCKVNETRRISGS